MFVQKHYLKLAFLMGLLLLLWRLPVIAPTSEKTLPLAENKPPLTTLLAVGDIMLSRNVSTKIERAKNPDLPFSQLKEILASADITFGNLECPLDQGETRIREGLIFRCLTRDAEGIFNSGFDVLATANNHAFDQGLDNIDFTIDYLKSRNILPVGTTSSLSPPYEGEKKEGVIERDGIKFGFLAYSYSARNDGGKSMHPQIATMNIENLKTKISNLKSSGADMIIILMHAGHEYTRKPNQDQIDFAHAAIDAGADIVLGHHPHWIQTIELYQGKPIFYSLGNFVFDQMWSQETREGLMVELQISDFRMKNEGVKIQKAKLIPIIIDNYCCPRLADETEKLRILKKINLEPGEITF